MIIRSIEFLGSVVDPGLPLPDSLPQIAFSGRSNVGKSSLINTLLGRKRSRVAHVSGTPGKTRALNFYRINQRFLLVDLPGFGFARVPEEVREGWKRLVEGYLTREEGGPAAVVHLVDARRPPTPLDEQMVAFLQAVGIPAMIVLTKADKLTRTAREPALASAREALGVSDDQLLLFSSKTGEGRDELLEAVAVVVEGSAEDARAGLEGGGGREG